MSSSCDYPGASDALAKFVRSLPDRELQKKCSSVNLQATGPRHVLITQYLDYLRSSNSAIVTGNSNEESTLSDSARAAVSTSGSTISTALTQTSVDVNSDFDSNDTTSGTNVQGQKRAHQDSEAAPTPPLLKRQKAHNQAYEEYICPLTLVSAATHSDFLFLHDLLISLHPCQTRISPLTLWSPKTIESMINMPSQSFLKPNQTTIKLRLHTQDNRWAKP